MALRHWRKERCRLTNHQLPLLPVLSQSAAALGGRPGGLRKGRVKRPRGAGAAAPHSPGAGAGAELLPPPGPLPAGKKPNPP